ncbi:toxin-antitoxin system YwqK family antitoxin [Flavobacterium oreochromis]|uniref:toxin-antitoxin system YwqK family antitoxin n=1 Tax=Flavobacterium oreochromis TaxID=2906078 RepID=UPI0035ADAD89
MAGELLQGEYKKFYHSNQLAEQGTFKKGLRVGTWKTWYENGKLATVSKWSKGLKRGKSIYYNTEGNVIEIGTFKKM